MHFTRRSGLTTAALALGASALPRILLAQDKASASFRFPVEGGEVVVYPVEHASMVIETPGGVIYVDPVGGAEKFSGMPAPSLILITHQHGDHYDQPTLEALPAVRLITNPAVNEMLPDAMKERATAMENGDSAQALDMRIAAIPAYNTTPERMQYHPEGRDNGYVLTIGGSRFYIAGDTEPVPEMAALENIEVAFLPMNLPYTMTIEQAAEAVATFKPKTVFPYHHRGSDVQAFAQLVEAGDSGAKVVIADWYPNGQGA
ncbi:MAG: MBL fold metallo-hydrolase [Paracoccus sp. (in: a-proteobacteria)]|uniref:MBL fold metallo-hydrolase n=1 Tax=Paracoccus sp. TaxID=267 RepID=UPI00405A1400